MDSVFWKNVLDKQTVPSEKIVSMLSVQWSPEIFLKKNADIQEKQL